LQQSRPFDFGGRDDEVNVVRHDGPDPDVQVVRLGDFAERIGARLSLVLRQANRRPLEFPSGGRAAPRQVGIISLARLVVDDIAVPAHGDIAHEPPLISRQPVAARRPREQVGTAATPCGLLTVAIINRVLFGAPPFMAGGLHGVVVVAIARSTSRRFTRYTPGFRPA